MATLLDSYSETNKSHTTPVIQYISGQNSQFGNTVKTPNDGINYTLDSCKFYLSNIGGMTGTIRAVLKAITGTAGTDATPTGSALGTSDTVNINTLPASTTYSLITFNFTGVNRVTLTANTNYCLYLECPTGDGNIDSDIYVGVGNKIVTTAGMNYIVSADNGASWTSGVIVTNCFYLYGEPPAVGPSNLKTYNTNVKANVKSINTNLIANVKTLDTNA